MTYLMFPIFAVVSIVIITTAIANGEPPLWFALVWSAIAVWNGYWFCWQIGNAVEVHMGSVTWRTILRSRTVPLADVTGVEPFWVGFQRLTVRDGPSLFMTGSGRGWVRFLQRMRAETGATTFEPTGFDRMFGWMPEITGGYYEATE